MNGREATLVGVFLLPGANALEVADSVVKTVDEIVPRFPQGMTYSVPYDTDEVRAGVDPRSAVHAGRAMLLVVLVVFVFPAELARYLIPIERWPVSLSAASRAVPARLLDHTLTLFAWCSPSASVVDDPRGARNIERICTRSTSRRASRDQGDAR